MNKRRREQEGIIHVYFRANGRYTVFYDEEDNLELLRRIDKFAKKFDSKIMEFALMGNHAHFLVNTHCVTELMRETLKSYSRWYNKKYKNSNKVFKTPFSSTCKREDSWILESSAYILLNPVKAGMCRRVEEYKWNSAAFHFRDERKYISIGYRQYLKLCEAIEIDTELIDKYFKNYHEFIEYVNFNPVVKSSVITSDSKWESITIENLMFVVRKLLNGRILNSLNTEEIKELITAVYAHTGCKMLQIASILHVDYKFVKQCLRNKNSEAPQPE